MEPSLVRAIVGRIVVLNAPSTSPSTIRWRVLSVTSAGVRLRNVRTGREHITPTAEFRGMLERAELLPDDDTMKR